MPSGYGCVPDGQGVGSDQCRYQLPGALHAGLPRWDRAAAL